MSVQCCTGNHLGHPLWQMGQQRKAECTERGLFGVGVFYLFFFFCPTLDENKMCKAFTFKTLLPEKLLWKEL